MPLGLLLSLAYAMVGFTQLLYNNLGTEGPGIQMLFLSPTPIRTVLLAKNLFHALLFAVDAVLVCVIATLRYGAVEPVALAASLRGFCSRFRYILRPGMRFRSNAVSREPGTYLAAERLASRTKKLEAAVTAASGAGTQPVNNLLTEEIPPGGMAAGSLTRSAVAYSHPFFDYIVWSDAEGEQIAKWTTRSAPTRRTKQTKFPWFMDGIRGKAFQLRPEGRHEQVLLGDSPARVLVVGEPSINTGEFLSILMKTFNVGGKKIAGTLVAPLTSVSEPVLPPGYAFDVVASDGAVLFSSRAERNKRGNLLHECGENEALEGALQTRTSLSLKADCEGSNVSMFVNPFQALDGAGWSIVARRDMDTVMETEAKILLRTMMLAVPWLIVAVPFGLLLRWFLGSRKGETFWPEPGRVGHYTSVTLALILIAEFGVMVLIGDSRSTAYFEMPAISVLAAIVAISIFRDRHDWGVPLACALPLMAVFNTAADDLGFGRGMWQLLIGICVGLVVLLARGASLPEKITLPGWVLACLPATAGSVLLFICSALPVLGCYRVAHEIVQTTTAMRDLVRTSDRIADRTQALEFYYHDIQKPVLERQNNWFSRTGSRMPMTATMLSCRAALCRGKKKNPAAGRKTNGSTASRALPGSPIWKLPAKLRLKPVARGSGF